MRRALRRCGAWSLVLSCGVQAAAPAQVEVRHLPPRYDVALSVRIDAPPAQVYATFVDVTLLPQINPSVREARLLQRGERTQRVSTRVRLCVAFFCRDLRQVQDMRLGFKDDRGEIHAEVLPALSDMRFGSAHWQFEACGQHQTCLQFRSVMEPDFWVPPMIGPWMIQRALEHEARVTSEGFARLARTRTPTSSSMDEH